MFCCRGTPADYLAEKILDIESYANHRLGEDDIDKLLFLLGNGVEFAVFSRLSEARVGVLSFIHDHKFSFFVVVKTDSDSRRLCVVDVSQSSKKIAFKIADSLAQM